MIRIEQLDLAFFGHFTNKQFDFGKSDPTKPDFHIIYGVNEAGKTTFMESYLRLLYGFIPRNEPYAFRHGRANLHISALLQLDGEVRKFQRKGTTKNSLVDEQGNVLPEASLQAHLGGLAMDDYRKLLCIDDDSIDKGGEEIVNSRGDIGTLLFSAAAGISDLWQVLESVRMQAEDIHKSRSTKTRLAVLKKEYNEVVKQIKKLDIPADKLGQLTKALKRAETAEAKVLDEQRKLMVEERKLGKLLNALPMLERLDLSEEAAANMAIYPQYLDLTGKQINDLIMEQKRAYTEQDRLQVVQSELSEELKKLPPEPAYAGLEVVLTGLGELHSRYRHAELELDKQLEALTSVNTRMSSLVRERLHHELDPEALVVDAAIVKSLNASLAQREEAARRVSVEQDSLKQLAMNITNEESKLKDLEKTTPEGVGLAEILEQYNAQALSGEHRAAAEALREAESKVESALDVLSIKGKRFTELPECSLMVEEAETFVERWQALSATLATVKERQQIDQQEFNTLLLESKQLESVNGLASDQDTQVLSDTRETAWNLHKESLTLATAETFEPTMRELDLVMEGRLAHASDLARLRDVHRQLPRLQGQLDSHTESLRLAEQELQTIEQQLASVMLQAGIEASLPPKAVVNWVRSYHEAKSWVHSADRLRNSNKPISDKAQKLKDAVSVYIKREQATLAELLPAASTMAEVFKRHEQSLTASQQILADLRSKDAVAVAQLETSLEQQRATNQHWQSLVSANFPEALDADKLATSLDALSELRECNVEREALQIQCKQMQRDKTLFTEKLEELAREHELEPSASPDSYLNKLQDLVADAKKHIDQKALLQKNLDKAFAEGIEAEKSLEAVKAQCELFASMFHTDIATGDLTELYKAVEDTQHAQRLRKQFEDDLSNLRETLGVPSEEKARTMLANLDIQSLEEKQVEKESALELVNEKSKAATEKRTRCEEQLSALTGDGEVAQLVEHRTTLELQMSEAALEFLKLSLGHKLAEQSINRYRDKHRSGMMEATETAFAELTDGKYRTLQTQSNGKEETLLALDKDGTAKRADEMSKGTRFQLYLALRAAAYDQLAEQGTCLPFICDDIFETFDEDRTRAACRVMERIGQRGQAIYLTHHRHVVELAQEVCGDRVQVHEL